MTCLYDLTIHTFPTFSDPADPKVIDIVSTDTSSTFPHPLQGNRPASFQPSPLSHLCQIFLQLASLAVPPFRVSPHIRVASFQPSHLPASAKFFSSSLRSRSILSECRLIFVSPQFRVASFQPSHLPASAKFFSSSRCSRLPPFRVSPHIRVASFSCRLNLVSPLFHLPASAKFFSSSLRSQSLLSECRLNLVSPQFGVASFSCRLFSTVPPLTTQMPALVLRLDEEGSSHIHSIQPACASCACLSLCRFPTPSS